MTATEKLIKNLISSTTVKAGEILVNSEGQKYRYDEYRSKYKFTPYWLEQLFYDAAKENNKEFQNRFSWKEYSFYFDRAKFKGQRNGNIQFNKLVIL